ncbi:MAG: hypothetical protein AAF583_04975 [Pseudomonadota bacterium]
MGSIEEAFNRVEDCMGETAFTGEMRIAISISMAVDITGTGGSEARAYATKIHFTAEGLIEAEVTEDTKSTSGFV